VVNTGVNGPTLRDLTGLAIVSLVAGSGLLFGARRRRIG
jgi:hypothetical protein